MSNHEKDMPFLHKPDEHDIREGMVCWRDDQRLCSGACVAFNPDGVNQGADQCVLLVYKGQIAAKAVAETHVLHAQLRAAGPPRPNPPPPTLEFPTPRTGHRR